MSWLRSLGTLLYLLGWQPGCPASPGEALLGKKLAELEAELRTVSLEKKSADDELRVTRVNIDMLTALVERERARVRSETEWLTNSNRRGA